jgi:hypothetical protein
MTTFYDYFLKCESQEQADTLLESAGLQVASDDGYIPADGVSIYHVGVISTGGEWDEEGNEIVTPTVIEGWHVNLRLREILVTADLDEYLIEPTSPRVVFG